MKKNVSGQKLTVFAWDSATGLPKTGDAANITAYVDKDDAGMNALTDTSASEIDSTHAKGFYRFDVTQAESNGDKLCFGVQSSTSGIVVMACPPVVFTVAQYFGDAAIDSSGRFQIQYGTSTGQINLASGLITASTLAADTIDSNAIATSGANEIRNAITGGSYALSTDSNGRLRIVDGTSAGELDTSSGTVTVGTNNDKTGYSLSQSFPTNFSTLSIDGSGRVDLGKWIGTAPLALTSQLVQTQVNAYASGKTPVLPSLISTATSGSSTTATVSSFASGVYATDYFKDQIFQVTSGSTAGQCALITGYNTSTGTFTFAPALSASITTNSFAVIPLAPSSVTVTGTFDANVLTWLGSTPNALQSGRVDSYLGAGANDVLTAAMMATDMANEIRNAITGGAYALSTDSNGRLRIVDGTSAGELDTTSGKVDVNDKTGFRLSATGVDDIWDEVQSGHTTSGTFGKYLDSAVSGVSTGGLSASDIATAIFTDLTSGSDFATVGSIGKLLKDNINATISSRSTLDAAGVWAAGTRTLTALGFTIGASDLAADCIGSSQLATSGVQEIRNAITGGSYSLDTDANGRIRIVDGTATGDLDTSSGTVTVGTNNDKTGYSLSSSQTFNLTGNITGNLSGSIGSLGVTAKSDVNAEVVDTLNVDTYPLPGQTTPSTTPTIVAAILQHFQQSTNPMDQDSSTQRLYNRAGSVVHQKRAVSDDGTTTTLGALVAGP